MSMGCLLGPGLGYSRFRVLLLFGIRSCIRVGVSMSVK